MKFNLLFISIFAICASWFNLTNGYFIIDPKISSQIRSRLGLDKYVGKKYNTEYNIQYNTQLNNQFNSQLNQANIIGIISAPDFRIFHEETKILDDDNQIDDDESIDDDSQIQKDEEPIIDWFTGIEHLPRPRPRLGNLRANCY